MLFFTLFIQQKEFDSAVQFLGRKLSGDWGEFEFDAECRATASKPALIVFTES